MIGISLNREIPQCPLDVIRLPFVVDRFDCGAIKFITVPLMMIGTEVDVATACSKEKPHRQVRRRAS